MLITIILYLLIKSVLAQFDWGAGNGNSCQGSGNFQQRIEKGTTVVAGTIPASFEGVRIELVAEDDVDIQLVDTARGTKVIAWPNGIINEASQTTMSYKGDTITYSGYNGVGNNAGHEFVQFKEATNRAYEIRAYGYASGYAKVTYKWTGQADCNDSNLDPQGSGSFMQSIAEGSTVIVGNLPAGLTDVYIRLESTDDIDIQLYDEATPIIDWEKGTIIGAEPGFSTGLYAGVEIQYSGYQGEQRSDTFGHEYIFLRGSLTKSLTLKVLGYKAGKAEVNYSWGYYTKATSSVASTLWTQLHDIIHDHRKYSYGDCWELLKRTDQDPNSIDHVRMLYSRKSVPKVNQDNGSGGDLWNREHVWPKSHGNFGTKPGAGTDLHALRASDASVNADRSSKDFDNGGYVLNGPGSAEDCPDCLEDLDSFEPPDQVKGDVARMIFYMAIRYNGDSDSDGLKLNIVDSTGTPYGSSTTGNGQLGKQNTLKQWHEDDPPSDEEKHRNNLIFVVQGNRNPFIDNPQWVNKIF